MRSVGRLTFAAFVAPCLWKSFSTVTDSHSMCDCISSSFVNEAFRLAYPRSGAA